MFVTVSFLPHKPEWLQCLCVSWQDIKFHVRRNSFYWQNVEEGMDTWTKTQYGWTNMAEILKTPTSKTTFPLHRLRHKLVCVNLRFKIISLCCCCCLKVTSRWWHCCSCCRSRAFRACRTFRSIWHAWPPTLEPDDHCGCKTYEHSKNRLQPNTLLTKYNVRDLRFSEWCDAVPLGKWFVLCQRHSAFIFRVAIWLWKPQIFQGSHLLQVLILLVSHHISSS